MAAEEYTYQLPKDWKWEKLGEVCNIIMGQSPPSTSYNTDGIGLPFFQGKAEFTELYPTVEKWCNAPNKIAEPNDVLLSVRAPVGTTNIANLRCCIGRGLASIRFENYKYAFYFLRSIQQKLDSKGTGTTFKAISGETIRETWIPIPPKPIQQVIVSKIEELFSELDKGIENLRTAQLQLKTYRQSILKWAFEGKLTNENVKEGELPKGWKNTSIEEVATVGTGATPLKSKSEYYGGNIAWVTSGALNNEFVREATDFVTEKAVNETNLSVYPKHTLLVAMYGEGKTRGKCSELLIEACTNQAIAAIYFDELQISVKPYLKYFLLKNYTDIRKKSSGGVQPNLNLGIIKKLQFPLAPIEEQNKIIQEIEGRLSIADKMEESITQSLQQAEALRQSILKKAFEGKLVIEQIKTQAKLIPIERKVLAAWIIYMNHEKYNFGLTMFQKDFCLVEHFIQPEYEISYGQHRAGPYDREFTQAFRKEMIEKGWFSEETKRTLTKFVPGENVGKLIKQFATYYRGKANKIKFILNIMKDKTLDEAELIATIYAAWNNRLIKKELVDTNVLIGDVYSWSLEKQKYSTEKIEEAYKWMKEVKLIPAGFGKIINLENK
jgi:type I restriction enzyme S subunit